MGRRSLAPGLRRRHSSPGRLSSLEAQRGAPSEPYSKGAPEAGVGRKEWGEDRSRTTREHSSNEFQPSQDKPHWAPSSLADRQKRRGEGERGGHVWFGVWFPLLCLANSLERRRLTAPGTGTLVSQGEKKTVPRPSGLDPLRISHLALQITKRQPCRSVSCPTSFLAFSTLGRGSVPDSLFLLYLVPRVRFTEPEKVSEGKKETVTRWRTCA